MRFSDLRHLTTWDRPRTPSPFALLLTLLDDPLCFEAEHHLAVCSGADAPFGASGGAGTVANIRWAFCVTFGHLCDRRLRSNQVEKEDAM